eukprot:403353466
MESLAQDSQLLLSLFNDRIPPEVIDTLFNNGFDNADSLQMLECATLEEMGIQQAFIIEGVIKTVIQEFHAIREKEFEISNQNQLADDIFQENLQNQSDNQEQDSINIQITPKLKSLTRAAILLSVQQQSKQTKPLNQVQQEQLLSKQTHLHLNKKKIESIEIDSFNQTPNLKVLYLFDNQIQLIQPLAFKPLTQLIQLSLYNNKLTRMNGFEGLKSLRKLYLEKNCLSRLEGLTDCSQLEELYLSGQVLPQELEFTFDDYSLATIAQSLKILDISNSRVIRPQQLYYCENLDSLNLSKNQIEDFEEDQVVLLSRTVQELDNKQITQQERQYLIQLVQRKQLKSQQNPSVPGGLKGLEKKMGKLQIAGQNKVIHQQSELVNKDFGQGIEDQENEYNQKFYEPLDDKDLYQHKQMKGKMMTKDQQTTYMRKKSVNINANNDFNNIGQSHASTKYVPKKRF